MFEYVKCGIMYIEALGEYYKKQKCLALLNCYTKKHAIIPIITEDDIPKTSTGPATVNILAPTPIIYPSDLYSIAGETIEFAKPVIGTRVPAPANLPILLKIFKAVKSAESPIKLIDTIVLLEVWSNPLYKQNSSIN